MANVAIGTLYLIPTPLGNGELAWIIPDAVRQRAAELEHYIVEHPKTARRFLKQIGCIQPLQKIHMSILDEHTPASQLPGLLNPLLEGADVGLLSEAGCPAVADPGAALVRLAHQGNFRVVPLVGPSSILLALMASGLNGQCFAFQGYLPIEAGRRAKKIAELEKESIIRNQTQIFIETPYRNQKLAELLVSICRADTSLCIACNLTLPDEHVATRTIEQWKGYSLDLDKKPSIFLLLGGRSVTPRSPGP
ncbi:MAG TPA: SAM-dependent methyltransferase [Nitrosospira sp.]|nr:SAM-dependent methyltransferase [Nitrosospira sp.]